MEYIGNQKKKKRRRIIVYDALMQFIFFVLTVCWMEMVYHIAIFGSIDFNSIYIFLFSVSIGAVVTMLTGFFKPIVNKIIAVVLVVAFAIFYAAQLVYKSIFQVPLLWGVAKDGAGDVTAYWKEALNGVIHNLLGIILVMIPIVILGILLKKKILPFKMRTGVVHLGITVIAVLLYAIPVILVLANGKNSTIYEAYHELTDFEVASKNLGMFTTFRLELQGGGRTSADDLSNLLEEVGEVVTTPIPSPLTTLKPGAIPTTEPMDSSPNSMPIDFDRLIAEEKNETIKTLHKYFKSVTPTNKNEYTGMFEGKNLIFLTAEAYSPWAVDEKLTPTLYKLTHEGFIFNNFYTALWVTSTSDGEYVATQGLLPDGSHSFRRSQSNYLPFTMAAQFNRMGITSYAYHDNTLSYYDRYLTHPNMGYQFKAANLGALSKKEGEAYLFDMKNATAWPASDYDMMVATLPEVLQQEPFHAYYMTVSGHAEYNFVGQRQAKKNKDLVVSLPYSDLAKAYIAANIELDKALEYTIQELDKAGVLENTVIALSADHYPYALPKDAIDELAGHKVDETFELYKNNFILWSASMKEPVVVDKVASSADIIPTLSNLFGFTYDSRLLSGRDILSDCEPLVIFKNRSFITDKVMYDAATKKVTYLIDKGQVGDDYIDHKKKEVKARCTAAGGILDNDYYGIIKEHLKFEPYNREIKPIRGAKSN